MLKNPLLGYIDSWRKGADFEAVWAARRVWMRMDARRFSSPAAACSRSRSAALIAGLAAALLMALCLTPGQAHAERRIALVIGQSRYTHVPVLDNPTNDARLVAATLRKLNFEIVGQDAMVDLDKAHFDAALKSFSEKVQGADVALVYYAGHGVQVDNENFLVPTDANPSKPSDVYLQMVSAAVLLKQLEGAGTKLNIVLFDACRNSPFGARSARAAGGGLAQMQAPEGTLISYATQPGNVALDGANGDSPYTLALVEMIQRPGLGLFEVFNEVGLAVKRATGSVQQPWVSSSPIEGGFYFAGSGSAETRVAVSPTAPPAPVNPGAKPVAEPSSDPVATCDRLAAGRQDAQRPPGVAGVDFADLDYDKAVPACRAAVTQQPGAARLMFEFARALSKSGDDKQADVWFRKAAAAGSFAAMDGLGYLMEIGKGETRDFAAAMVWYRKAAAGGNTTAMHRIGSLYSKGLGVTESDQEAYGWFLKSAEAGDLIGMIETAKALAAGDGVTKNPGQAFAWFRKAAEAGNASAMTQVGIAFTTGAGAPRDPSQAAIWFQKAANLGDKPAMRKLADAFEAGNGVDKDLAQAKRWRRRAED